MQTRNPPPGLDPSDFMRRFWQREPLLVRGAFPGFEDPLPVRDVLALAARDDAQSRLVRRQGARWTLEHGPFAPSRLRKLPRRDWTVLVQDTNHFSDRADALLRRFDFIPHARVDDLMVSYAVPGGSVGPHVDSYDVFLLQGRGRRRWRISRQRDHAFVAGLPLRILERFRAADEWTLEPGDMLYLPPHVAHHGIAETECLTWSVGFRAPANEELARALLDYLHDRVRIPGRYEARDEATRHPGAVPAALLRHVARVAGRIRWSAPDLRDFTGAFLTEPKAHVFFEPPARALGERAFARAAGRRGVVLDRRTRLLFSGSMLYVNGEAVRAAAGARALARRLADRRRLAPPLAAPTSFWTLLHAWYRHGFVHVASEGDFDER